MLENDQISKIKEITKEFFDKVTIAVSDMSVSLSLDDKDSQSQEIGEKKEVISLDIRLDEPQILIGQGGQTLLEIQRLLRLVLSKRFQKSLYLNLDINDYKKKKIEYLKVSAKELADQVSATKEEKILPPMSSYERRIMHAELSNRNDIITESQGEGLGRHIVIKPK